MQSRISMITLGVTDLAASISFYERLGFPRLQDTPPTVAFFTLNGTWLGLFGREELAKDAGLEAGPAADKAGGFNNVALAHNLASEAEVDEVFAAAIKAGATATKQPQKVFWGGYSGYFADPDGHLWEVAHNPFMWVGPEDQDQAAGETEK